MESKPARSLRLLCFYLRDTTGTARRESAVIRERAPGPLESLLPHTAQPAGKARTSPEVVLLRQHPIIPSPSIRQVLSCVGLHECDPIFVQRIAVTARGEQRLAICRLKKANLVSRFAHHRLAHTPTNRNGSITSKRRPFRQAIELGSYCDTTFRRLKNSEEKYQFGKSASGVQKFSSLGSRLREQIVYSASAMPTAAEFVVELLQISADCRGRMDPTGFGEASGNRDKARMLKNAGEVGSSGGSFILPQSSTSCRLWQRSHTGGKRRRYNFSGRDLLRLHGIEESNL